MVNYGIFQKPREQRIFWKGV